MKGLVVRDYDGSPYTYDPYVGFRVDIPHPPIPITVDQHFAMVPAGTLRMVFESDAWDSTISFASGIPVTLGGTLGLTFANDVNLASQVGRTLDLFDWTGVNPTGAFAISSPYDWDLSNLYTTGQVTLTAIPEPLTSVLLSLALISLFQRRPNRASRHRQLFSRLYYLLLMILLIGVLPNSADAQVKVFILAGQSNAVGFCGNANVLPAALREPFEDVLFWYDIGGPNGRPANDIHVRPVEGTSTWVPLRPQVEFGGRVAFDKPNFGFTGQNITTGHGAELTLGRELAGRLSDQIAILKFAWNGTPLSSTSGQDWNVSSQGEYYDSLVAETSTALSHLQTDLGKSGEVAGFFWMQGESDAYAGTAELYEENLQALVDAARDVWGESLPVVIAQAHKDGVNWVHPMVPRIVEPYLSEIRAAQQSVAAKSQFVRTVDLDDILLTSDSVHFDSVGLQVVGQRLADAYLAIVPEPLPGDFNRDGTVDAADYVVWRKNPGGNYTQDDFNTGRANFGATLGSGTGSSANATVPEPATLVLLMFAATGWGLPRLRAA